MLELEIERIVHRGLGLARTRNKIIFVRNAIAGEKILCQIEAEKSSYAYAFPKKILNPSPYRIEPACKYYPRCGGCQLAHIEYSHQLEIKQEVLKETFSRLAKLELEQALADILPSPSKWRYRTRIRLHCAPSGKAGFQASTSPEIVPIKDCLLAQERLGKAIPFLEKLVQKLGGKKERAIELDLNPETGKICALQSARKIFTLKKQQFLAEPLSQKERLRLLSFIQPNLAQNQNLKNILFQMVEESQAKTALELFSGFGNFSFELGSLLEELTAVELNPYAVRLANILKEEKGISQIKFIPAKTEDYLKQALKKNQKFDLVILDPPRTGARKEAELLLKLSPEFIIYISCEPSTLARDLKIILSRYRVRKIQPLDMFPQTFHIETVAFLERAS